MLTPRQLRDRLIAANIAKDDEIQGCTKQEISQLENRAGGKLPTAYKKFLKVAGKGAGEFMSDLEVFYPDVLGCTDRMRVILADYEVTLPDDAFVFVQRFGEQLLFFHLTAGNNDPPIFRWSNDQPDEFVEVFPSLWHWIEEELVGFESLFG